MSECWCNFCCMFKLNLKNCFSIINIPPTFFEKKGHIVLHLSVGWSVCRPSNVCSVFWPPFPESCQTWNLGCPLGVDDPHWFSGHMVKGQGQTAGLGTNDVRSICNDPFEIWAKGSKILVKKAFDFLQAICLWDTFYNKFCMYKNYRLFKNLM